MSVHAQDVTSGLGMVARRFGECSRLTLKCLAVKRNTGLLLRFSVKLEHLRCAVYRTTCCKGKGNVFRCETPWRR
jgi:hypothetical protein